MIRGQHFKNKRSVVARPNTKQIFVIALNFSIATKTELNRI